MANKDDGRVVISAEKARQGEVVLRRRWQRVVFAAGLAGVVVLAVILWSLAR